MESDAKHGNVQITPPPPPLGHSAGSLKFEVIDDDFCIDNFSSSSSLQDFHHLDQLPLIKTPPFNDVASFDPFFDLYEDSKPYDQGNYNGNMNNIGACAAMQGFHGGGFLNFANRKDPFMEIDPKPLSILAPDESSCVTADYNKESGVKKGRYGGGDNGTASYKKTATGRRKAKSGKGQWTPEEDRMLINLVEKYGEKKWSRIAQLVKGRIGKQCRERWHNHLRPDIKKDLWMEEEDRILIEAHAEIGNKWAEIAKRLEGRTENSIKNHWNATKRRQLSRRKCRTKWPRPSSLLQNYIKSLDFQKSGGGGGSSSSRLRNSSTTVVGTAERNDEVTEMDFQDYEIHDDFGFMDDLPAPEVDVGLPFDVPPLMQLGVKEGLDFAMG